MDKDRKEKGAFLCGGLQRNLFSVCTQGYVSFLKETSFHYIFPSSSSFALALDTFFVFQNTAVTERWESVKAGKVTQHWFDLKVNKEIKKTWIKTE